MSFSVQGRKKWERTLQPSLSCLANPAAAADGWDAPASKKQPALATPFCLHPLFTTCYMASLKYLWHFRCSFEGVDMGRQHCRLSICICIWDEQACPEIWVPSCTEGVRQHDQHIIHVCCSIQCFHQSSQLCEDGKVRVQNTRCYM